MIRQRIKRLFSYSIFAILIACTPPPKITPQASIPPIYDYPINNPYAATIIGMPPEMKVDYSAQPKPDNEEITLFKSRKIPDGFWYEEGFKYSQLIQPHAASVVYVIGGTGADRNSETTRLAANILYAGGFSVVLLPSPTNANFIINASRNYIVGNPAQDAEDLYNAIQIIDKKISASHSVTGRMLLGYSLGGIDAAFTAKLDDQKKAVGFSHILLINPPLSLYSSMQVIDKLLYRALPGGINEADRFIKTMVSRLSRVSQSSDALGFANERLLIDAYNTYKPGDDRLSTLIGLSFRLAAADMIFTSDVMSHSGYIFPKNQEFTTSTPLNDYFAVALRTSFKNYFDDIYTETFMAENPGLSRQDLITQSSLEYVRDYIATHPEIGLITNQDDIILAPGESARLAQLFGSRATVYPNGGHLGNLGDPAVGYHIIQFLTQ